MSDLCFGLFHMLDAKFVLHISVLTRNKEQSLQDLNVKSEAGYYCSKYFKSTGY